VERSGYAHFDVKDKLHVGKTKNFWDHSLCVYVY